MLPDGKGKAIFDCDSCNEAFDDAMRAARHCGFMDRDAWTPGKAELPPVLGGESYKLDVCPGWIVRQPSVVEAADAFDAYEHGEFSNFYPDTPNRLVEAVQAFARALKRHEAFMMREQHGDHS